MHVFGRITGTLAGRETISGAVTIPAAVGVDAYTGSYEVTPSQQAQTLNTAQKYLARNITINPIPSNYGLITWNGSTILVS